jgi:hypothetical protein
MRGRGGFIGANVTPASAGFNSAASGFWNVREAESLKRAGTWPTSPPGGVGSGLQLWLDASDALTLFDATTGGSLVAADGAVARWEDKSGNSRHFTQSTSGNRPMRKTNQQNGLGTLLFDGTDDNLAGSDFMDGSTGGLTVFFVYKRNATGARHDLLVKTNTNSHGWMITNTSGDKLQGFSTLTNGGSSQRSTSNAVSASSYIAVSWRFAQDAFTSMTFKRNGVDIAMDNATNPSGSGVSNPPDTSGVVRIGAQEYLGSFYHHSSVNFAEIIIYDSALSDANRALLENYLLAKWGIA